MIYRIKRGSFRRKTHKKAPTIPVNYLDILLKIEYNIESCGNTANYKGKYE
jgi:hypothetical protein